MTHQAARGRGPRARQGPRGWPAPEGGVLRPSVAGCVQGAVDRGQWGAPILPVAWVDCLLLAFSLVAL